MFLGGAGLADTMLYCRDKIYPLGLPNGLAMCMTAMALPDEGASWGEGELPAARSAAAERFDAATGGRSRGVSRCSW